MPKLSIIIPVYDAEKFLTDCLDGILAQTHKDWEAICINDGSRDNTRVILDSYAQRDSRFRVFHRENYGASASRNFAMDLATGDYILFVDSDDKLHPQALERLTNIAIKTHISVVRFGFREVFEHSKFAPTLSSDDELTIIDFNDSKISPTAVAKCGVYTMLDRKTAKTVLWPILINGEDGLFAVICYRKALKCAITSLKLVDYLQHSSSLSHERSVRMYQGITQYFQEVCKLSLTFPNYTKFKKWLRRDMRGGIVQYPDVWAKNQAELQLCYDSYFQMIDYFANENHLFSSLERQIFKIAIKRHSLTPITLFVAYPRNFVASLSRMFRSSNLGKKLVNKVKLLLR